MISKETEAEIARLYHGEKWPVGTIAKELGVHHTTVQRVLRQIGVEPKLVAPRPSMADPFVPFILEQLEKYPRLRASRLFEMVKARGYPGGSDHFRRIVAQHRPRKPAEAFQRLRTLPGEQAQVDWAHFGKLQVGQAERPLWAFVMVLSYSRRLFLRFFPGASMPFFLRGHVDAFVGLGGVARVLLYDNLKSAVLERRGDAIRFHPTLLELAAHYRFEPRPVVGVGITISPVQARRAQELIATVGLHQEVQCHVGNFLALPPDLRDVDLAFSIEALVHSPNAAKYFSEVARVLRPGGRLAICDDFLAASGADISGKSKRWIEAFRKGWRIGTLLTSEQAQQLAAESGLRLVSDRDLTPYLRLDRARNKLLRLAADLARLFPPISRGPYWSSMIGGAALQRALRGGALAYRLVVFERPR